MIFCEVLHVLKVLGNLPINSCDEKLLTGEETVKDLQYDNMVG